MRKTHKPPQMVTIVWHSDITEETSNSNNKYCKPENDLSRPMPKQTGIPVFFRDTICCDGIPVPICLEEFD